MNYSSPFFMIIVKLKEKFIDLSNKTYICINYLSILMDNL